ncbi:hypothetical protein [Pseudomonas fluorescens]|uniref:hypothetical protein n=1 Tax=Pseudomonas fluorescens TaxID=294 RepID=UPI00058A6BBD|nr:hypothetical protein [Pseudomonas fluorescens]CEL31180.1 hypothetical protein SRM1_04544 [Pseudomonas fluorescens]
MNLTPKYLLKTAIEAILFSIAVSSLFIGIAFKNVEPPKDFKPTKSSTHLFYSTLKDKADYVFNSDTIGLYKLPIMDVVGFDDKILANVRECISSNTYSMLEDTKYAKRYILDDACYELKKFADSGSDVLSKDLQNQLYSEFKVELESDDTRRKTKELLESLKENDRAKPTKSSIGTYDEILNVSKNVRYLNWSNDVFMRVSPSYIKASIFVAVKHMPCTAFKDEFYPSNESTEKAQTKCEKTFRTVVQYLHSEFLFEQYGVRTYDELTKKLPKDEKLTFETAKPNSKD